MPDLNQIDQFMNDASDQAAAWYSILTKQPAQIPSATIVAQQAAAVTPPASVISYPGGIVSVGGTGGTWLLLAGAALVALLIWKA